MGCHSVSGRTLTSQHQRRDGEVNFRRNRKDESRTIVGLCEDEPPPQVPSEANAKPHDGGGTSTVSSSPKCSTHPMRRQPQTALGCLVQGRREKRRFSHGEGKYGLGHNGELSQPHRIDTHMMTITTTRDRIECVINTKEAEWPRDGRFASVQEVLSIAGKLWNLAYVTPEMDIIS